MIGSPYRTMWSGDLRASLPTPPPAEVRVAALRKSHAEQQVLEPPYAGRVNCLPLYEICSFLCLCPLFHLVMQWPCGSSHEHASGPPRSSGHRKRRSRQGSRSQPRGAVLMKHLKGTKEGCWALRVAQLRSQMAIARLEHEEAMHAWQSWYTVMIFHAYNGSS